MNQNLQHDEQNRDFISSVSKNINDIQHFLTRFEKSAKERLNSMNGRMDRMEQTTRYLEYRLNKSAV
jgi:flagellar capping protein FliD